jgi:hypothetical protein
MLQNLFIILAPRPHNFVSDDSPDLGMKVGISLRLELVGAFPLAISGAISGTSEPSHMDPTESCAFPPARTNETKTPAHPQKRARAAPALCP